MAGPASKSSGQYEDDAVRIGNESPRGLSGFVPSGSVERAPRVAKPIESMGQASEILRLGAALNERPPGAALFNLRVDPAFR
jgi:hypothetical protein